MPLYRKIRSGESKDKYVSSCMSSSLMKKEFPDVKQRVAVCLGRAGVKKKSITIENLPKEVKQLPVLGQKVWLSVYVASKSQGETNSSSSKAAWKKIRESYRFVERFNDTNEVREDMRRRI